MSGARIHQPQAPAVGTRPRPSVIRRAEQMHDAWITPCFRRGGFLEERNGIG